MKKRTMKVGITVLMASAILLGVGTRPACAATNEVSALLQKGLFEEEANQNLEAAIQAYQGVIAQTEKNRQYAATAIFRLGECYRKEGKTSEANVQYQRILSEFPDQTELAKLSRDYLGNAAGPTSTAALDAERQANQRRLLEANIGLAQKDLDRVKGMMGENAAQEKLLDLKLQLAALDAGQPVPGASSRALDAEKQYLQGEIDIAQQQLDNVQKMVATGTENHSAVLTAQEKVLELKRQLAALDAEQPVSSTVAAREADRQLLEQEIAIAQRELDRAQKLAASKLLSEDDLMAAQEKVLELKHQLAVLDAGQTAGTGEAVLLAQQIAGIEKLKADPEEQARGVVATFPDEGLKKMLENLPKLQEQLATLKTNSGVTPQTYYVAVGPEGAIDSTLSVGPNDPRFASEQANRQVSLIQERVNFIMGIERARLKVLQGGEGVSLAQAGSGDGGGAPVTDEEEQEIKRIQEMIQNSPDLINAPGNGNTSPPLVAAARSDWLRVARYLLDHQAKVDVPDPAIVDETPLITAADNGHKAMVELLLERGADVNARDNRGITALHLAAQRGFLSVTETLIAHKADINATDHWGGTPLHEAAQNGRAAVVKMLLTAGANPNAEDNNGRTPLSLAAEKGSAETVKTLLEAKVDPNGGRIDQPLLSAIHAGNAESAELLLKAGANPNTPGTANWEYDNFFNSVHGHVTPIFFAVYLKQLPMVELLLKHKADPNDSQTTGEPLIFTYRSDEVLRALLEGGADANAKSKDDGGTLLVKTFMNPDTMSLLLSHGADVNAQDKYSRSALSEAVVNNRPETVKLLLAHHAKVDILNKDGWTPLEMAVGQHNAEIAELLLDAGADLDRKFKPNNNTDIMSPLELAAISLDSSMVEVLLAHRANPNLQDEHGETALSEAKMFLSNPNTQAVATKIVDLLVNAKANENLQRLSTIGVVRSGARDVHTVFLKGTNTWNNYTLLDLLAEYYAPMYRGPNLHGQMILQMPALPGLDFPDFAKVRISRLDKNGRTNFVTENLEAMFKSADCSKNLALQWGDIVEIPEADHNVNDTWAGLSDDAGEMLRQCLASAVAIVVKGRTNLVTIKPLIYLKQKDSGFPGGPWRVYLSRAKDAGSNNGFGSGYGSLPGENPAEPSSFWLSDVVHGANVILTSSDLSRVKVTRTDARTGRKAEMEFNLESTQPDTGGLWLRDGDVVEIPEK